MHIEVLSLWADQLKVALVLSLPTASRSALGSLGPSTSGVDLARADALSLFAGCIETVAIVSGLFVWLGLECEASVLGGDVNQSNPAPCSLRSGTS